MPPMLRPEKTLEDFWLGEDTQLPRCRDTPGTPSSSTPRPPLSSLSSLPARSLSSAPAVSSSFLAAAANSAAPCPLSASPLAPFSPAPLPSTFSFSPLSLQLSDKTVPQALSAAIRPSAYLTNIWASISIAPGFSSQDFFLIARSLPNAEYTGGTQPLVLRLKNPSCTAVLGANGRLSIMGGLTLEQARWQAYRVAYKLRFRLKWRFRDTDRYELDDAKQQEEKQRLLIGEHFAAPSTSSLSASSLSSSVSSNQLSYVHNPEIRFVPEEMKIQQMVCRLNMGGEFRPDLERVESHPSLQGRVVGIKDGLTIRVPLTLGSASGRNSEGESCTEPAPLAWREETPNHSPTRVARAHASSDGRDKKDARLVWKDTDAWSDPSGEDEIAAELFAGFDGGEDPPASPARRGDRLSAKRRKRGRTVVHEEGHEGEPSLKPKKGATCIVYRSGRVLVLGCTSTEEIDYAVSFVWPALVGL